VQETSESKIGRKGLLKEMVAKETMKEITKMRVDGISMI
jgi:hypothetical protein